MNTLVTYCSLLVHFIMFNKYFCQYTELEMELKKNYEHEAYVAGIGTRSLFEETKLIDIKQQTLYFSRQSAAGKLIGFQLRLPTRNKIYIKHFGLRKRSYLFQSVIQGPITVLMHEYFEVTVNVVKRTFFYDLLVRILGTLRKTREYMFHDTMSELIVLNDPDIGHLTGISIRILWTKAGDEFPNIKNVTVAHHGRVDTFIIDSQVRGPATVVKLLDKYEFNCHWTTWTEIITNNKYAGHRRSCLKYGITNQNCDTCPGESIQFVSNKSKSATAGQYRQWNPTNNEGIGNSLFYVVIAVLVISISVNFAMISLVLFYRRRKLIQKQR